MQNLRVDSSNGEHEAEYGQTTLLSEVRPLCCQKSDHFVVGGQTMPRFINKCLTAQRSDL